MMFRSLGWRIGLPFSLLIAGLLIVQELLRMPSSSSRYSFYVVLIGAIGIAFGLTLIIVKIISRPIQELTRISKQLEVEKTVKWSLHNSYPEIEQLGQAVKTLHHNLELHSRELEEEHNQQAAILTEMSDGVVLIDQEGIVRTINPAIRQMFGAQTDKAVGNSLIEAFRQHQLVEVWRLCVESNQTQVATLELPTSKLYLQIVATPLGDHQPSSTLLLIQDLTRLHRLEIIRQDLIHNISHELRTPLASLKALTETLLDGALDDPPAAQKFLLSMETEVDSLSLTVSELIELSRIESGRVPLKMAPVSPCEMLSAVLQRLELQAERSELQISIHCPDNLPDVLADRTRIEQVLVNLLHNAIKFTPRGGEIQLAIEKEVDSVIFSVKDNGIGIPADDLPRIFERFFKSDRSRRGGGTGLGLAISKHLVDAHGGSIWAESTEGLGSTFYFTLPTTNHSVAEIRET